MACPKDIEHFMNDINWQERAETAEAELGMYGDALIEARRVLGNEDMPFLDDGVKRVIYQRDQLRVELERVQKQSAAMRKALELCEKTLCAGPCFDGRGHAIAAAQRTLSINAGHDYISKESVQPLVEALRTALPYVQCEGTDEEIKQVEEALELWP